MCPPVPIIFFIDETHHNISPVSYIFIILHQHFPTEPSMFHILNVQTKTGRKADGEGLDSERGSSEWVGSYQIQGSSGL